MLDDGLDLFRETGGNSPAYPKMWMMKAQLVSQTEDINEARKVCQEAVKHVPYSVDMWLVYAQIESSAGHRNRARAILETARSKIPKEDRLWRAACQLETNRNAQQAVLSKALLECPMSGRLWSFAIECEKLNQQKPKCSLALNKLPEDVHVLTSVAKFFWRLGKKKQAREWFERAVVNDSSIGDTWAWYLVFCRKHKKERHVADVTRRCVEAQPTHGVEWVKVSKDPKREHLSTEEVLHTVVDALPDLSKLL